MTEFELTGPDLRRRGAAALELIVAFVDELPDRPALDPAGAGDELRERLAIAEQPDGLAGLLDTIRDAAAPGFETAGPRHFGYIPAVGLTSAAIGNMLALALNRYTTLADMAPGMVAMEEAALIWLCREFELPGTAGGLLTSGASAATLTAIVAAREDRLGEQLASGTLYVSEHTHYCVAKSARIAGLPQANVRRVPVDAALRIDVAAAARMIANDRSAGRRPFLIVGTAGSIDIGAVDPLAELAAPARAEGLWFHVDGAYGGAFQLTARGREQLAGISEADTIVLDPHKGLFMPYGTGPVLARDARALVRAHSETGPYLQDLGDTTGQPDYADRGIELTREHRGLKLWLPLRLHGVAAFRRELDEKLDLAAWAHARLDEDPEIELPWGPGLSTVTFRLAGGENATRRAFDQIRREGRLLLTSTTIRGRFFIRLCVLSHRSHAEHVAEAVEPIRATATRRS